jgi:N-acetylglucosamine malate deacetylase 1
MTAPMRALYASVADHDSGRALVGLPNAGRVVVIAPHPDDESIGCGGTLAVLAHRGTKVTVCTVTDGEAVASRRDATAVAAQRRREAEDACGILGLPPPRFLGLADGQLADDEERLTKLLAPLIDDVEPDVVMLPWPFDAHRDHRAIFRAVERAELGSVTQLWMYEVWSPLPANRLVDISAVVELKRSAMGAHRADTGFDPEIALALNRYRAATGGVAGSHAEAFCAVRPEDLSALHS